MRYEADDGSIKDMFEVVLAKRFPWLSSVSFCLLFDTKRRDIGYKLRLADILLVSEKIRFLTRNRVVVDGYDYVLTVDKVVWGLANKKDRARLISHELRHCLIMDNTCKLKGHDIEDFVEEIELNEDDPEWCERLARKTIKAYQIRRMQKKRRSVKVG